MRTWRGDVTMTKWVIGIDGELLASTQRELQTVGVSDTVHAALRHAIGSASRARQIEWLTDGGLECMSDADQWAATWQRRPRDLPRVAPILVQKGRDDQRRRQWTNRA